jgi:ABC-type glutathione transport system ATPase component
MSTQRYSVQIRAGQRMVVSVDNYDVPLNQITFFFGESGIGKSMISKAVYGLLDPDELSVTINGTDYRDYLNNINTKDIKKNSFFVFQEPSSHLNSLLKISEQLNEGSLTLSDAQSEIMAQLWQTADEQDINQLLDVYPKPYRPSGGEKQRILLAMAFKKIDVLLKSGNRNANSFFVFDEPTGSLDNRYRNLFLKLLIDTFRKQPFTIMIITHDYSIISEMQARYRDIIDKIHYKELRRKDGAHVEVVDFSANEYLDWLSQSKQHHETVLARPYNTSRSYNM